MAILDLVLYPDPLLKTPTGEVSNFDDELRTLLNNMSETMYEEDGVGLAAPQVGELKRVTVIDVSDTRDQIQHFVNPKIMHKEGKASSDEGCLSIPGYRAAVERAELVVVQAKDGMGELFEVEATGLFSYALQHEIDHLDGVLFVDHLSRLKRDLFKKWLKRQGVEYIG